MAHIFKISSLLMTVCAAIVQGGCSDDLKEFQICIEEFHANNPIEPPKPDEKPDFLKMMAKGAKCFTDNKCKDQTSELAQKIIKYTMRTPVAGMRGPPKRMGRVSGERSSSSRDGGKGGDWMAMKKAKWDCIDKIAQEVIVPKIESCVQAEIPDWEYPVHPENKTDPYDPFGEGPDCKHTKMMMMHKMMAQKGLGSPALNSITAQKRTTRGARKERRKPTSRDGDDPMDSIKGLRTMTRDLNPRMIDEFLLKSIFDESVCPKDSREAVGNCLSALKRKSEHEMTNKNPGPLQKMLTKYTMLDDFCEHRQTCWDKISENCENDFWDQKWYVARCYQQHVDSMDNDAWDALQTEMDECMAEAGAPPADISLDEEDDGDDKKKSNEATTGKESPPEGKDGPISLEEDHDWKTKMLRKCLSRRFQDGPIKNPCRKVDGLYEFMKHHHHGHHHEPHYGGGHHGHHHPHHGPSFGMEPAGMMDMAVSQFSSD